MIPPAPAHPGSRHIPSLDGLRGIAILLIIAFHYFDLPFGWSGVDLFFVLSGYLITGRLLDSINKPARFSTFYRNRILRIFPLYYGVLLAFFIGIHFFTKNETQPLLAFYFIHWKSFFLFTQNFSFIIYGMPVAPYLLHFWSLAIEEQFYLVWPSLVYLSKDANTRLKLFASLPILIGVARCLFFFYHPHSGDLTFFYYNTFFRIDTLIIGALLCQLHYAKFRISEKWVNILIGSSLILLAISYAVLRNWDSSNSFFETVGYTITAIFFACILHKAVSSSGSFTRFFSLPGLQFLGKISYGLYIFHFPVFLIFQQRIYDWGSMHLHFDGFAMKILSICLCLPITFLLSLLSYRYYESFFLRLKKR
jgi:peptidoglycan/LPS O-acetylase OafA/YrhL